MLYITPTMLLGCILYGVDKKSLHQVKPTQNKTDKNTKVVATDGLCVHCYNAH